MESAVLIRIPEAELLVGGWRGRFDPSAALGIPAHITMLYPFVPVQALDADTTLQLRSLFAEAAPFVFELVAVARFPSVVYLEPEPDEPLRRLIDELARRFPDHPPYGGAFEAVVPHLTVAQTDDEDLLTQIGSDIGRGLPIEAHAREAVLMTELDDGLWRVADTFPFGGR